MVVFDDNELNIILITYNRDKFVQNWIEKCGREIAERNINFSIYDSSTNEKTKLIVDNLNNSLQRKIIYKYVSDELSVGHVVFQAVMESNAKYVWVVGDSRCHNFSDLDEKVFPYIKKGVDHIVLHTINNEENDGKIYRDKDLMVKECFVSMTCTGFFIFRTEIFNELKNNDVFRNSCMEKYDDNYGFTWMGYFLEAYAKKNYVTAFTCVPVIAIEPEKKIRRWSTRFYKCWCSDLCNILDGISLIYNVDDSILKFTWKLLGFDTAIILYNNRKDGVLNPISFEENRIYFSRVSNNTQKVYEFAYVKEDELDDLYTAWRKNEERELCEKLKRYLKSIKSKIRTNNICIYGAGRGGIAIARFFEEEKIPIKCFYDINASSIENVRGIEVRNVSGIDIKKDFIIVSLIGMYSSLLFKNEYGEQMDTDRILYLYYV